MAAPTTVSAIPRYRTAILLVTGAAAVYGAALAYSALRDAPTVKSGLHRSNAVHRQRRSRDSGVYEQETLGTYEEHYDDGDDESPFGHFVIESDDARFRHRIGDGVPGLYRQVVAGGFERSAVSEVTARIEHSSVALMLHSIELEDWPEVRGRLQPAHASAIARITLMLRQRGAQSVDENIEIFHSIWPYSREIIRAQLEASIERSIRGGARPRDAIESQTAPADKNEGQDINELLYHIAEEEAKRQAYLHRGTTCDSCGQLPIRGVRWHCLNCPDFDLCSTCEAQGVHQRTHVFAKVKTPIPLLRQPHYVHTLWYPGDPRVYVGPLDPDHRRELIRKTGFTYAQIDAFYDQFSCLVDLSFADDPSGLGAAIGRRAFVRALQSDTWPKPPESKYLYERIFDFYDADRDRMVSFDEFVCGVDLLQRPSKPSSIPLASVFRGYDSDGDGYINRTDCLRLLSAKYSVHQAMIMENVVVDDARFRGQGRSADIIASGQPLSAAFHEADIPFGEVRSPQNKLQDLYGDMQVLGDGPASQTIITDGELGIDPGYMEGIFTHYAMPHDLTAGRQDEVVYERTVGAGSSPALSSSSGEDKEHEAPAKEEPTHDQMNGSASPELEPAEYVKKSARDIIFKAVLDSFNESLDLLFAEKEQLGKAITSTASERKRYATEIAALEKQKLEKPANGHPPEIESPVEDGHTSRSQSNATQASSEAAQSDRPVSGPTERLADIRDQVTESIRQQGVPNTDEQSLAEMESSIREQPLDSLLESAGYYVADRVEDQLDRPDPTMPQNRPNAVSNGGPEHSPMRMSPSFPATPPGPQTPGAKSTSDTPPENDDLPPSPSRLEFLLKVRAEETASRKRNGRGRLSVEEFETIVTADQEVNHGQLREILECWLEWATL